MNDDTMLNITKNVFFAFIFLVIAFDIILVYFLWQDFTVTRPLRQEFCHDQGYPNLLLKTGKAGPVLYCYQSRTNFTEYSGAQFELWLKEK